MKATLAAGSILVLLAASLPAAQQVLRDRRAEPSGAGVISGIVETDETPGRPQRRATVTLSGAPLVTGRTMVTGDNGRFAFANLPAGQFMLSVRKGNYLPVNYGATRPGGAGAAIVFREGQQMTDVHLRLSAQYGAIAGTIYDQGGEPVLGMSVEVLRYTMRTGRRTLSSVYGRPQFTDDRGMYWSGGLTAGEYFVAAGPSPDLGAQDLVQLSASDVDRALQTVTGGLPGPPGGLAAILSSPRVTFAPVFYPGATDLANASSITLKTGEEKAGVDIRLQLVPTARLTGAVTGPAGQPASGVQVVATMITQAFSLDLFSAGSLGAARVDGQGRFSYAALAPGQYVITARAPADPAGGPGALPLWAMTEVAINGVDQTIALNLQPGMSVSGKVVFDGTSLQPPAGNANVRIGMSAAGGSAVSMGMPSQAVNAAGAFSFSGAAPGHYMLTAGAPPAPAGWVARSALVNGIDALDLPFELKPGQNIDGVVVTYTDHPAELSGALQVASGTPTSDYFIIVFSTNRSYWTPLSRRSVSARPATSGKYLVRNLPPGEYFVAAVTDVEQGDWYDPAFLEKLVPASTRVTLGEGEKKSLDLKLTGG